MDFSDAKPVRDVAVTVIFYAIARSDFSCLFFIYLLAPSRCVLHHGVLARRHIKSQKHGAQEHCYKKGGFNGY
jgi:hypothetical protein